MSLHNYYRHANQNYNEVITSHWSEWPIVRKKSTNNKCWRGCGEKGMVLYCWWECKLIQGLWRRVLRFLKKIKIELTYDPVIPLLGIYPEKTTIQKDACTPVFIASLFTIARSKCPIVAEWMKM